MFSSNHIFLKVLESLKGFASGSRMASWRAALGFGLYWEGNEHHLSINTCLLIWGVPGFSRDCALLEGNTPLVMNWG